MRFGGEDVVRHKLVQRIVAAYDEHAEQQAPAAARAAPPAAQALIELELIDAPEELRAPAAGGARARPA